MTATNLVVELEKAFSFQGHSIERRRLEALALIRLYAEKATYRPPLVLEIEAAAIGSIAEERDTWRTRALHLEAALRTAINSVECASIDPVTKEELPWYKQASEYLGRNDHE